MCVPKVRAGAGSSGTPGGGNQRVLVAACWAKTSRLIGSVGRDSKGRVKEATCVPIQATLGAGGEKNRMPNINIVDFSYIMAYIIT